MEDDVGPNVFAEIYHELGCDMDDLLENSRKSAEKLQGRYESIREMASDIAEIIPGVVEEDSEDTKSLKLSMSNYFKTQEGVSRDRLNFQKGFCRAVEAVVAILKEKYEKEILNPRDTSGADEVLGPHEEGPTG